MQLLVGYRTVFIMAVFHAIFISNAGAKEFISLIVTWCSVALSL